MESVVDGPGCWRVFASYKNPYPDLIKYSPSGLNGQVRTSSWMERQRDILYNCNFKVIKNIEDHFLPSCSKNRVNYITNPDRVSPINLWRYYFGFVFHKEPIISPNMHGLNSPGRFSTLLLTSLPLIMLFHA